MIKYNCQENETGTNLDSHSVVAVFLVPKGGKVEQ